MTDFEQELAQLRADVVLPDAEAAQRVSARLSRTIGALAPGASSLPRRGFRLAQPLQIVAGFVTGGVVGALLYGALRPPKVESVYVERPAVSASSPAASAPPEAAPPELAPRPSSRPAALPQAPLASAPRISVDRLASLAEQQALLDDARVAFARSDYTQTLQILATHAARFPKSVLAEEREALQIKALAGSDRQPEARARATRFQARYPQSLLLPSIKDSVGAIP